MFLISVLTRASLTDRLIPLPVLTLSFPAEEEPAELAYAESFMFISFLINKVGREAFHRLIQVCSDRAWGFVSSGHVSFCFFTFY